MKFLRYLVPAIVFIAIAGLAPGVVRDSLADQTAKAQIAEINSIKYGIFSVNAWKSRISTILVAEVEKFDLKTTSLKLRKTIEDELAAVIDKLNEQIREENKKTLGGRLKQVLINLVVNVKTIKDGVPRYADAIIEQFGKPETQQTIKSMATKQLKSYLAKSFTPQDQGPVDAILAQTGTTTIEAATQKLEGQIQARHHGLELRSYAVMLLAALLFLWAAFRRNRTPFAVATLFGSLVILLFIGVSIPMIDLEAKITDMGFVLLGHDVSFSNQMLYFQSKSVINVFWLMVTHHDLKMKAVGILVITFSIVFPILKMAASIAYFFGGRIRDSKVIQFFAFKIGKWSMADVMVIAIFMGYIGFNGIVGAQLKKMDAAAPQSLDFFTTNGTTLQMGYYIFITYVLLAMVLSGYVHASEPLGAKGGGSSTKLFDFTRKKPLF